MKYIKRFAGAEISYINLLELRRNITRKNGLFHLFEKDQATSRFDRRVLKTIEDWDISPYPYSIGIGSLAMIYNLLQEKQPSTILEVGSGLSTRLFAHFSKEYGFPQKVVSVDQSLEWLEKTKDDIHNIDKELLSVITFLHIPVTRQKINNYSFVGYNNEILQERLQTLDIKFDLLFIDGPSGCTEGRFMVFYSSKKFLSKEANLILHDALRDREIGIIKGWLALNSVNQVSIDLADRGLMKANIDLSNNLKRLSHSPENNIFDIGEIEIINKFYNGNLSELLSLLVKDSEDKVEENIFIEQPKIVSASNIADEVCWEDQSEPIDLILPLNAAEIKSSHLDKLLERDKITSLQGGRLYRISGVQVTEKGPLIHNYRSIIKENLEGSLKEQGFAGKKPYIWKYRLPTIKQVFKDEVLFIEKHGVKNHALWILEVLCRAYFAWHIANSKASKIVFCEASSLPKERKKVMEEMLDYLAPHPIEINYTQDGTLLENVFFPVVNHFNETKTRLTKYSIPLFEYMINKLNIKSVMPNKKLFITRQDSHVRRIVNYEEVVQFMEQHGYLCVNPGEYNWKEQAALFAHSKEVIGIHGAGLVNVGWMSSGSTFTEIFPPQVLERNTFRHLAIAKGLNYRVMILPSWEKGVVSRGNDVYETHIDTSLLTKSLELSSATSPAPSSHCTFTEYPYVFVLGLNKCGTTSLHEAFKRLGWTPLHTPYIFNPGVGRAVQAGHNILYFLEKSYNMFSDIFYPFCGYNNNVFDDEPSILKLENRKIFFELIDEQYPGSKFICNVRNKEDWLVSRKRHVEHNLKMKGYRGKWLTIDEDAWSQEYDTHYNMVFEYFKNRSDFLVLRLEDGIRYETIVDFLDLPFLEGNLPIKNRSV